ncbi:transcription factor [Ganoderma sinense ZZ0214-1]|uniref:Transcription factor n=1 Tax=Ganoderma sinense ZZ0214-1 TaxID=1077348 RepID=A0A2G8SLC0_9APHY|nr:transcription factor [Ganoderma sinense ZZ0214-1]
MASRAGARAVKKQFEDVLREYYAWEPTYCSEKLGSLAVSIPLVGSATDFDMIHLGGSSSSSTQPETETRSVSATRGVSFEFDRYIAHDNDLLEVELVRAETIDTTVSLPTPYPSYESCTPTSRNILHGDDPHAMPFLPFADDPSFNPTDYVLDHKRLAWQEGYRDTDLLEIVLETARRLHFGHGMSIQEIDDTGILPRLWTTSAGWGAIWHGRMSDPILWPGSSRSSHPPLPDLPPPERHDLQTRLQDYLTLWCPNVDCTEALCLPHASEQYELDLKQPRQSGDQPFRLLPATVSCGPQCEASGDNMISVSVSEVKVEAATLSSPSIQDDIRWTEEELRELKVICYVSPPTTPCLLAHLCRKPCREVAVLCREFGDAGVADDNDRALRAHVDPVFRDPRSPGFVPNAPCAHAGPCTVNTQCACSINSAHCTRSCRCGTTCVRRWKGCHCQGVVAKGHKKHRRTGACATDTCPCKKARRECDPDVCTPCGTSCRNMQIQQRRSKSVSVRQSAHGLGLFLEEYAKEGDLVSEYVGELIYEPTFQCRSQLAYHVGRSYAFGLNSEMSVDSTKAGNPARFINHAPHRKANLEVSIMLVHGEQRIGIYARKNVSAGTELFMDYGPDFPI